MMSYIILLYFTLLRLFLKKVTKTAKLRAAVISSMLLYLITFNILTITSNYQRDAAQQMISFFILMFYIRVLRESWKRIFMVVWDSLSILVIIMAFIIFYTLICYTLFSSLIYEDEDYFPDLPWSLFNMYVLFTTSNFPDIVFPFWKVHNWTAVIFVLFLLVGLYMLLNLMLAVFYNSYK